MAVRTVKVNNVSLGATEQDIREFFSFSGDIEYVELRSCDEWSQVAYVTFRYSEGVETALLLSGATIVDMSVIISVAQDYQLPATATKPTNPSAPPMPNETGATENSESALRKAEDVVSGVLAKSLLLGKDVLNKAKSFDEKHQLTSTATSKVSSFDKKIGLSDKVSMSASLVNEKVKGVDKKFHVSEKAKSTFATAEEMVGRASSAILKNRYAFTSVSFVAGAFSKVSKAAGEVTMKTKEKMVSQQEPKASPHIQQQQPPPSWMEAHPTQVLPPQVTAARSMDTLNTPPPPYDSIH